MAGVRIVADSACDLSLDQAERLGVTIVPLEVRFGDDALKDRVELTPEEFWRRTKASTSLPTTAAPSPGAFRTAFQEAAGDGATGVVCLTLSSALSATYQAALAGAEALGPSLPVRVIDTRTVTMGEGLACMAAAELAADGAGLDAVAERAQAVCGRTRVLGVVGALDHLQRGGRIGGLAALVGSLLAIKPVIEVREGLVAQESRQRTRERALDYLVDKVRAAAPLERVALCDGTSSDFTSVVERVRAIGVAHDLVTAQLGPAIGTHSGPGTIGICFERSAQR